MATNLFNGYKNRWLWSFKAAMVSWSVIVAIPGVTKRYGTNFRTHSSHLEDEIMLYEHGSGNFLFPWGKCTLGYVWLTYKIIVGSPSMFCFTFSCFHATDVIACFMWYAGTYLVFFISHLLMYYEESEKMDFNMEIKRFRAMFHTHVHIT